MLLTTAPDALPSLQPKAEPTLQNPEAEGFYAEAIRQLVASGVPFLLAGTYAVSAYTGISRQTKDIDVFCKPGDYPQILAHFKRLGYRIAIEDTRWLAKVFKGRVFLDVIFASSNGAIPMDDRWFEHARQSTVFGTTVKVIGPTELVWSKCFIQARDRYDGSDVAHIILRACDEIDWSRLLHYMDVHWEVLLIHLLNFQWLYPSQRSNIPEWLMDELLRRLATRRLEPPQEAKLCRGRLLSSDDYEIDIKHWGFKDVGGNGEAAQ
jgi:hypothetical protein